MIPFCPPSATVALAISDTMLVALRKFESELQASSRLYAKLRRESDPNAIFRGLQTFQPNGVDALLGQIPAHIVEVRHEDMSVVLDKPIQFAGDQPIVCNGAELPVVHADHDCLWLETVEGLQLGSPVTQLSQVGTFA